MSVTTFDTLKFVKRLTTTGMAEEQAEALSEAFIDTQEVNIENLATKSDLKELELTTKADIKKLELTTKADIKELELRINAQLLLLKWMIGFILAGIISLIMNAFFIS